MKFLFIPTRFKIANKDIMQLMAQFTVIEYQGDSLVVLDATTGQIADGTKEGE